MVGNDSSIRVLIADDQPVVREGLAFLIERQPDMTVVAEAGNGREAVERFREVRPDITLMDLCMPEMDGAEAIHRIREESSAARVIVLTTYDGDEDIYRGLQAGAKGYLLKDAARDDLLAVVRAVHRGKTCIPPEVAAKLADRVGNRELTSREREVLQQIAYGKSNQEIAAALFIAEGTVKAHVNNLLAKLGANDRTQALTLALKRGIVRLE